MRTWDKLRLDYFLAQNPKFRMVEVSSQRIVIAGEYHLRAQLTGSKTIDRAYHLKLVCPRNYPRELPKVFDVSRYFPRDQEYHTYSDGSFCLGSELKLKSVLQRDRSLGYFFEKVVDPFLYSVSHRIEFGSFPLGELAHGEQGLIDDYEEIFGVKGKASVLAALKALGKRKREANKLACPCGCGHRLGRCKYRFILNQWRFLERRRWYREHLANCFTPIVKQKKKSKRR